MLKSMMDSMKTFPTGKLPWEVLQGLLRSYTCQSDRVITGPAIGEDVAVIDMGDRYMVVKTDPITFATDQIGWYAVNINANDIATSGAQPMWMLNTVLLPEHHTTPELVDDIFRQLRDACAELGIVLVGGHTEVTWGLDRPIVVGVLIGEVSRDRLVTTAGARVGDKILLVKGIPIEATAIIAREKDTELRRRGYSDAFIDRARNYLYDPGISVVSAAQIATDHPGVHAMHDPTEGGLATGIHELASAAGTGARVKADSIPILPEGERLCAEFGLDPLGAIASGALIVAVEPTHIAGLARRYTEAGNPCACIGDLVPLEDGLILEGDVPRALPRYDVDEITRLL